MEELTLDQIMAENQIDDFLIGEGLQETETPGEKTGETKEETTEVDPEEYLPESPESVGSGDTNQEKEDTNPGKGINTSPDFYSSIANAFVGDGIFQNLDQDKISEIKTAEDFAEAVQNEIDSRLDEEQRRIKEYMSAGVDYTELQKTDNLIKFLDSISEDRLTDESDEGEDLRKRLIFQDYINKGFSQERAERMVNKSLQAGTDIEDAKEALLSNREHYKEQQKDLLQQAKEEQQEEQNRLKKQAEDLRNSILDEKSKAFGGDIELDKATRQKVYDAIMKPVYKDPETGERLTAIQKYESENKTDFLRNLGLVFVLTDGFKSLEGLTKTKVNKEVKKGLRDLERTINNTSRTSSGNLNFTSGVGGESKASRIVDIDI